MTGRWSCRANWNDITSLCGGWGVNLAGDGWGTDKPAWFAVAMLPEDGSGNLSACATGAYDAHFRQVGQRFVDAGRNTRHTFLRLGWEANGDWYRWNGIGQERTWAACFVRQAKAFTSVAPNVQIGWSMNKDGKADELAMYPADDSVIDFVDVDWYDAWSDSDDAGEWADSARQTMPGDSIGRGIQGWADFARSKGKKFAVSEWGMNSCGTTSSQECAHEDQGGDNPAYVTGMHAFFRANADILAYETYFNIAHGGNPYQFRIFAPSMSPAPNPQSAAEYRRLF